jgi:hypothetical protein
METLVSLTRLLADLALGVWLGAMVFFSFVTSPAAFTHLDQVDATRLVTGVFPQYHLVGVVLGVVGLLGAAATGMLVGFDFFILTTLVAGGVAVAAAAYARWVLVPRVEAAEESGEGGLHEYSREVVLLNSLAVLGVAVAFVGLHF